MTTHTGSHPTGDDGAFPAGRILSGRYRIVALVGKGGMGEVYLADDMMLGEAVALKFLPEAAAEDEQLMEQFVTEVRLARQVTHPNVARVHDIATAEGRTFLSMEFVDGEDLGSLLKRIGRLPQEKAVEIAKQICEGLHAAHERGILHRDLKPANVMLDGDGHVRLTDFGLAAIVREGSEGRIQGTPAFMSPEQITGGELTVRSDIYSLGLVLYEIFTGKRAFRGKAFADFVRMQQHESPASLSTVLDHSDPAVELVIQRCIEKDPAQRPSSARQVTLALPGGDPLAAALASGDTPAPELVAAAGGDATVPVRRLMALFLAWVALMLAVLVLVGTGSRTELVFPGEKHPQVLQDRITTLLDDIGYVTPPVDTGVWLSAASKPDPNRLERATRGLPTNVEEDTDTSGAPGGSAAPDETDGSDDAPRPLLFHYRQSPEVLARFGPALTHDSPAFIRPGMVSAISDVTGRLQMFEAVPGGPDDPDPLGARTPVEQDTWRRLAQAADLDWDTRQPLDADWLPPVHTDERHSWTVESLAGEPALVEAAGLGGMPVLFRVDGQGDRTRSGSQGVPPAAQYAFLGILALFVTGAVLAWRNASRGRADLAGAWRVGLLVLVAHVVLWFGTQDMPGSIAEAFGAFLSSLGYSTFLGTGAALFYLSLEPFMRRRWPTALIGWNRALTGRLRDPVVAQDVLVGGVTMLAWLTAEAALDHLAPQLGLEPSTPTRPTGALGSALAAAASVIHVLGDTTVYGLMLLLLLVGLRAVVRVTWVAVVLWLALLAVLPLIGGADVTTLSLVGSLGFGSVLIFLLVRHGVLASISAIFVQQLLGSLDLTLDSGSWALHNSVVYVLALGGMGLWCWRAALDGRPAFGEGD